MIELRKIQGDIPVINNMVEYIARVHNEQTALKKSSFFYYQLEHLKKNRETMQLDYTDSVLMAFIKELCLRQLQLDAYDVQIMAAIQLYEGQVIEMKTGEGKTLVAIMATCLHLLNHRKVHIITANDYLSKRDYEMARPVFEELGFKCGNMTSDTTLEERVQTAEYDVLYTTNKEIAINYSNNRKAVRLDQLVQNPFDVLIVDEADLLMIDEARKELSIGNNHQVDAETFSVAKEFVLTLAEGDYKINPSAIEFYLMDSGVKKAAEFYQLENYYAAENAWIRNLIRLAFVADKFYKRDVNYIVKNNEIVLINTQTGRLMNFYKMMNGLQQALECKEGLPLSELRTNFTKIPYQHIFNQYKTKSGMTGTAMTEAKEFKEIYGLSVVEIPTNKPMIRVDEPDRLFATSSLRDEAVVRKVVELNQKGQPVLIGTASIEHSEVIAGMLGAVGLEFNLLNAKHHEHEAQVIKNAGQVKAVTIATNMAGRGTDIVVPNDALALGGLFIIGTERYASRRADNQLRGRTGRQGSVGQTQFYTSLEDEVIHSLNVKRIQQLLMLLKDVEKKDYIENPTILNLYNKAQISLEGQHYGERKNMLNNNSTILSYYQNFFNRKLYLMRSGLASAQILEKLLSGHKKDLDQGTHTFGINGLNPVDSDKGVSERVIDLEKFNELFNTHWVKFMNEIDMINVNMFLDFAAIGRQELIREKRVSEAYGKMVLKLRSELIHYLQDDN